MQGPGLEIPKIKKLLKKDPLWKIIYLGEIWNHAARCAVSADRNAACFGNSKIL